MDASPDPRIVGAQRPHAAVPVPVAPGAVEVVSFAHRDGPPHAIHVVADADADGLLMFVAIQKEPRVQMEAPMLTVFQLAHETQQPTTIFLLHLLEQLIALT
ncbi:hypothetical protein [Rhodoferax sediminis]|uniref:Uncharacterized protein n=1 Tax=Rhodoferax sediminis TaxID=2509614 RepID=A0A515DDM2_9BURK|nr:hypothetical protein [Rhodoferax sediminis]QDL38489.1 hypothetical protein EUB48_15210 [Rhodoferax sediminis]